MGTAEKIKKIAELIINNCNDYGSRKSTEISKELALELYNLSGRDLISFIRINSKAFDLFGIRLKNYIGIYYCGKRIIYYDRVENLQFL